MPKYEVTYGFDVPAYGTVVVNADNPEQLREKVQELYSEDKLIDNWKTRLDLGCENHRIVEALDEQGEVVDLCFPLEKTGG